jgi:hypothetical protein
VQVLVRRFGARLVLAAPAQPPAVTLRLPGALHVAVAVAEVFTLRRELRDWAAE